MLRRAVVAEARLAAVRAVALLAAALLAEARLVAVPVAPLVAARLAVVPALPERVATDESLLTIDKGRTGDCTPFRFSMKNLFILILAGAALLGAASLSAAHHATATEYDISKTIVLKGAVSKLEWSSPHVRAHLDVKPQTGNAEDWEVEFGSPGAMAVAGIVREALRPGTIVTIKAYPGKTTAKVKTPRRACAIEATLPDGQIAKFVVGI